MLRRLVALDFLQNVLWSMMQATQTLECRTKEQCRGILLELEPVLGTSKDHAIKELLDWINCTHKIVLPSNLGKVIRDAMLEQGNLYSHTDMEIWFQNEHRLGLKEARDFIYLMDVVLDKTTL